MDGSEEPQERAQLLTEAVHPASGRLDTMRIEAALSLIQAEEAGIHAALAAARGPIARAIELVVDRLSRGGRLFYVGAGTSGRLAMLDAVECPPTFQTPPELVQAVVAGGEAALCGSVEGAEDDREAAGRELAARGLGPLDVVFGITAGGTTPFVHGAIDFARQRGAATVLLACVSQEQAPDAADVSIRVLTGPEVLAGSTRLKAGTATKLVLNSVTTLTMARLGRVHGNLMVDVDTKGNAKLGERGARIVAALPDLSRADSLELLEHADGQVKVAVVMQRLGLDAPAARERLDRTGWFLRAALENG